MQWTSENEQIEYKGHLKKSKLCCVLIKSISQEGAQEPVKLMSWYCSIYWYLFQLENSLEQMVDDLNSTEDGEPREEPHGATNHS